MSKIIIALVIASSGYKQAEYFDTKKVLEKNGFDVIVVSDGHGTAVEADGEGKVLIDKTIGELLEEVGVNGLKWLHGLFFIGGNGALENLDNIESYTLLQKFKETGMPYGAICIAPRILAKAGVLKDKQATGWDGDKKLSVEFKDAQVVYVKKPVVVDGHIVTAAGPADARDFGEAIVDLYETNSEEME